MVTRSALLFVIVVAAHAGAAAAPPTSQPNPQTMRALTLDEALAYARNHQPALLAARARLVAAQAETAVPKALWFPRVGGTVQVLAGSAENSTASYYGVYVLDLPRVGATEVHGESWRPYASTLVAVGARQELYDFGRIGTLQAVARAAAEVERGRLDQARLDIDYAVQTAYFSVHAAKGVRAAADSAFSRAKLNRDTAAAGVAAGMRKPIELTRADADLSRFDVGRVRAQASLLAAQSLFAAVTGLPDLAVDAAGAAPLVPAAPTLAGAIDSALARDPVLQQSRARLLEQQSTTRAISAEWRPNLLATSTFSVREGGAPPTSGSQRLGLVPETPNWDVGLVLVWPIFDRTVWARAAVSKYLEGARHAEIAEVKQRLGAAVQAAYVELDAARQALPALESALKAARANYDQANARFKAGLGTSVELADAQALLAESDVQLTLGRFEYARARAHLGRVIAERQ